MKKAIIGVLLLLVTSAYAGRDAGDTREMFFSFDTLVTDSWFKKALDACMMMWGTMRSLACDIERQDMVRLPSEQLNAVLDAMAGNLAYADFCVKRVVSDNEQQEYADMAYLNQVITKMSVEAASLETRSDVFDGGRIACLKHLLCQLANAVRCDALVQ